MKPEILNVISRLSKYALLAIAALYVIVYLVLVFFRIQYPFELEWMEGGSLHQVTRILAGQKLYVSPSLEFVPYIYTPLYFYASALVSKALGGGFVPLRLLSFIASLGCFLIIFLIVKLETKNSFFAVLASCLFSAVFKISGAFFDIARVDSLFLFFLLAALYLIKFKDSPKSLILAGVLVSLSFLTKQTAMLLAAPIMLYCVLINWRRSLFFIGTICVIAVASTLVLDYIHDGWFSYFVFTLPARHTANLRMFARFWFEDLIRPLPIALVASIFYIYVQFLKSNKKNLLFYSVIAVGALGLSFMARLNRGGYPNALLPAYAVISILFGLAAHTAFQSALPKPDGRRNLEEISVCLVCIVQFFLLFYNPFKQIPTRNDLEAGKKLVSTIQQTKGDVFVPCNAYLPVLAGKDWYADESAFAELVGIFGGGSTEQGEKFMNELRRAVKEKRFDAIIINAPGDTWLMQFRKEVENHYALKRFVFDNKTVFWPVTGRRIRPEYLYVPKTYGINRLPAL
ncbi:MAG: glycosyltransferase family 39 protein [Phycisphaerae bacterium]|nr:glycosyltransferase family 39 protein [Phycisphaerae bacterium]MDD5380213.1 glycosyltransferase family 39 protein [Phycisphaerae bacterium]